MIIAGSYSTRTGEKGTPVILSHLKAITVARGPIIRLPTEPANLQMML